MARKTGNITGGLSRIRTIDRVIRHCRISLRVVIEMLVVDKLLGGQILCSGQRGDLIT